MEGCILVRSVAKCGGSHGKHICIVDDCFGKLRSRNFVHMVLLSSTSVVREFVFKLVFKLIARANMDAGSRKESRFSISSGVIQNDFSASILDMVLQIVLSTKPWTSSFVFLHSANQMLNIVLSFILKKKQIWYIRCCYWTVYSNIGILKRILKWKEWIENRKVKAVKLN